MPTIEVQRIPIGGCPVDLVHSRDDVLSAVDERLTRVDLPALAIASANLDHIHKFGPMAPSRAVTPTDTPELEWLTLLDGAPLVWYARGKTGTAYPKLSGSDLLVPMLRTVDGLGLSVAFVGGTPEMHEALRATLAEHLPTLRVAGMWSPTRTTINDAAASRALAAEVAAAGADFLVVGLGKPRQEIWVDRFGPETGARVIVAFGAAADFVSGRVQRAPRWMRASCLEWAYRLGQEPRRLGRRYLVEAPRALKLMLTHQSHS